MCIPNYCKTPKTSFSGRNNVWKTSVPHPSSGGVQDRDSDGRTRSNVTPLGKPETSRQPRQLGSSGIKSQASSFGKIRKIFAPKYQLLYTKTKCSISGKYKHEFKRVRRTAGTINRPADGKHEWTNQNPCLTEHATDKKQGGSRDFVNQSGQSTAPASVSSEERESPQRLCASADARGTPVGEAIQHTSTSSTDTSQNKAIEMENDNSGSIRRKSNQVRIQNTTDKNTANENTSGTQYFEIFNRANKNSRPGSPNVNRKTCDSNSTTRIAGVHILNFSQTKIVRKMANNTGPLNTEQVGPEKYVQNDNTKASPVKYTQKRMACRHRPGGRIFSYSDTSGITKTTAVHVEKPDIPVSGSTIWPHLGANDLHKSNRLGSENITLQSDESRSIHGRLDSEKSKQTESGRKRKNDSEFNRELGVCDKSRKITTNPNTKNHISGHDIQHRDRNSHTLKREMPKSHRTNENDIGTKNTSTKTVTTPCRENVINERTNTPGSGENENNSIISNSIHETNNSREQATAPSTSESKRNSSGDEGGSHITSTMYTVTNMVDSTTQPDAGSVAGDEITRLDANHGCLGIRVGSAHNGIHSAGYVAKSGPCNVSSEHQLPRTKDDTNRSNKIRAIDTRENPGNQLRQHDVSRILEQGGRNSLRIGVRASLANSNMVSGSANNPNMQAPGREQECDSRRSIPEPKILGNGMGANSNSGEPIIHHLAKSNDRPIRNIREQKMSNIQVKEMAREMRSIQLPDSGLGQHRRVCVSTVSPDQGNTRESERSKKSDTHTHSPKVASETVVPRATRALSRFPNKATGRRPHTKSVGHSEKANTGKPFTIPPTRLEIIKRLRKAQGFSEEMSKATEHKLKPKTHRLYDFQWREFYSWCDKWDIDPLHPTVQNITEFILFLVNTNKVSVRTARNKLSAINTVLIISTNIRYSELEAVSSLFKGLVGQQHISKTIKSKIMPTWHLGHVLDSLRHEPYEPRTEASLANWSRKTLFLIALASGRRVSEIAALSMRRTEFTTKEVHIRTHPHFRAKTQKPGEGAPDIIIPGLEHFITDKEEMKLCPRRALWHYRDMTKTLRYEQDSLFVCHGKGKTSTKPDTQTLARWFKEVVTMAYRGAYLRTVTGQNSIKINELDDVHIHQLRALGNSLAFEHGATMAEVMHTGFWKNPNTFMDHYLKDITVKDVNGVYRIGSFVAGQRVIA